MQVTTELFSTENPCPTPWMHRQESMLRSGVAELDGHGEMRNRVKITYNSSAPHPGAIKRGWQTRMKILWVVDLFEKNGDRVTQKILREEIGAAAQQQLKNLIINADGYGAFVYFRKETAPRTRILYTLTPAGKAALEEWRLLHPSFDDDCHHQFDKLLVKN
jgi:DNA-binding PadR family transcriptional regulator